MKTSWGMPAATASSTAYWISGLSTMGNISLGLALVAGKKRVPRPATGKTAVLISFVFATAHLRFRYLKGARPMISQAAGAGGVTKGPVAGDRAQFTLL